MNHIYTDGDKKELLRASSSGELVGQRPDESAPQGGTGSGAEVPHASTDASEALSDNSPGAPTEPSRQRVLANGAMAQLLAQSLAGVDLFQDFDQSVLLSIASLCRSRYYTEGQSVVAWKERSNDVFFVIEGQLRATLYSRQGKEVAFDTLESGDMFGELAAIDDGRRSTAVIASSDCQVAVLNAQAFRVMLRSHPAVAMRVLQRLARLSRRLCDRIVDFSTLDVRQRVHGEVLRLAQRNAVGKTRVEIVDFPTHAELASRISTHREAVTRELNALDRSGLIERGTGQLAVRNLDEFTRFVCRNRG